MKLIAPDGRELIHVDDFQARPWNPYASQQRVEDALRTALPQLLHITFGKLLDEEPPPTGGGEEW